MKIKRFLAVMVVLFLCVAIVGCKRDKPTETTYQITWDADGGTLPADAPTSYKPSEGLATFPTPTKADHSFDGWYLGNARYTNIAANSMSANVTFKARWTATSGTFTISYNLNGGTNASNAPTSYSVGTGVPTLPVPTKTGFVFAGWYEGTTLVTSIPASANKNYALAAKWGYAINYVLDGGALPAGTPAAYPEGEGLATLPVPTKAGHTFKGWFETADGSGLVENIPTDSTGEVTLYAQWSTVQTYLITYDVAGGVLPADTQYSYTNEEGYILPIPTKEGWFFGGWYRNGVDKIERIVPGSYGDYDLIASWNQGTEVYEPKWELNQISWTGNGMNFGIKVLPASEFDPFRTDYSGTNKDIKQQHQRLVEAAYDVVIVWSNWEDNAPWGPERVKFINAKFLSKELQNADMYVVNIASQWIPTLVKGGSIAELYNMNDRAGIFKDLSEEIDDFGDPVDGEAGYQQNNTINEATSVKGRVYGYAPGSVHPDYFMYYNADLVKNSNLEDPAELWLKGEWTTTKFDQWVRTAQTALGDGKYALDMGFAESTIGMVAAAGNKMASVNPPRIYFQSESVTSIFERIQGYYQGGFYSSRGTQDVSPFFSGGNSLLHHGDLWFMKNNTRFDPGTMQFTIGVVPYPAADGEGGIPVTTTDVRNAISVGDGEYLRDSGGSYITSVDMSMSSFQVPFTGTSCYSMLNVTNAKNGMNYTIATHILHDLLSGIGDDPNKITNLTEEEAYRNYLETRFDRDIDVEVIMSVQDCTYFEILEILSMTVGDGSHFGPDAYWPLCASICKGSDSARTKLTEVLEKYKQAMRDSGYTIQ